MQRPLSALLAELHRRRVSHVAVVYLVAAWAIVQVAETVTPLLLLPDWTPRLALLLVLLGFPFALILSWAFDVTPEGVRRTGATPLDSPGAAPAPGRGPGRRWMAIASVVALLMAGGGALLFRHRVTPLHEDRIVVLPLENQTGDSAFAPLGRLAADWIIDGVSRAGIATVVPTLDLMRAAPVMQASALGAGAAMGREFGAGTVVTGTMYRHGATVSFQARIVDVRRGVVVSALEPVTASADDPMPAVDQLRSRVLGALAVRFQLPFRGDSSFVATWSVRPPTYDAYRTNIRAMEAFSKGQFREAARLHRRAFELDSTFLDPLAWAATAYRNVRMYDAADSIIDFLSGRRDRLSPTHRLYLDWLQAVQKNDWNAAARASARLAESQPTTEYEAGLDLLRINRPRAALDYFLSIDPDRGWMRTWQAYWIRLTDAYHMLGRHRDELRAARRGRVRYPDVIGAVRLEVRALAAMGDVRAIREAVAQASAMPMRSVSPGAVMLAAAEELDAHGHGGAREMAAAAVDWYTDAARSEPETWRPSLAWALLVAGRWDEAEDVFKQLHADQPDRPDYLGALGVLAAHCADSAEVRRIDAALAAMAGPHTLGENTYWRAAAAAWAGQPERAMELLKQAFAEGQSSWGYLHSAPELRPLRSLPAFQSFIEPRG
ncbi:MAG: hypothetical protein P8174_03220 [Gemmatimonadota bacterium]|jgi:tetratricopeptide (TPR) repeat protein/TolB-like protein